MTKKKAVVLLSGGLDSATCLAMAADRGFELFALSFDYGQRQKVELSAAKKIAQMAKVSEHRIIAVDYPSSAGSSLTNLDMPMDLPADHAGIGESIPNTYVPGRNTIFISLALSWAESVQASAVFMGASSVDYSGYPDCRPEYFDAWRGLIKLSSKASVEGSICELCTPLLYLDKAQTIKKGIELGVDYALSISCYQADQAGKACGLCDACLLRREGFMQACIDDPTPYQSHDNKKPVVSAE